LIRSQVEWESEIARRGIRKIGSGWFDERSVAVAVPRAARKSEWADGTDVARANHGADIIRDRGPRKTGVKQEGSIQLPAAKNLASKIVVATQDGQIPEAIDAKVIGGVEV